MKKIFILLSSLFFSATTFAQLNIDVNVTNVSVTGLCDSDDGTGFFCVSDCAPADPDWELTVTDNRDYDDFFEHYLENNNGPHSIANPSGNEDALTFNKTYNGVCPPLNLNFNWEGFEYDLLSGNDADVSENYKWDLPVPVVAGTYTISRSLTATNGACGNVTWGITCEVIITGTPTNVCADDPCDAVPQAIQDGCDANVDLFTYEVSNSTPSGGVGAASCSYDNTEDVFFEIVAPASGNFTMFIDDWNDYSGATQANLTGNLYEASPTCSNVIVASSVSVEGNSDINDPASADCIDISQGTFNDVNNGPFQFSNLTPGQSYFVRLTEEQNQSANVTLSFQETLLEDNCIDAQPLTGVGCNYSASDINEPDTGSWTGSAHTGTGIQTCGGWSSNENMVWYYFDVTASTVQPISITVNSIDCNNSGGGTAQVGVFRDVTCPAAGTASSSNGLGGGVGMGCAVGTGNVTVNLPDNAPLGRYYVVVDGTAGAQCTWEFESVELLECTIASVDANIEAACNDNGTSTNTADDYYLATVTVTYNNPPLTGNLVLSGSAIASSTPAANLTQAVGALANPAVFNNIHISAALTNQTITAAFSDDILCTFSNTTISTGASCAVICPTLTTGATGSAGATCSGDAVTTLLNTVASNIVLSGGIIPTDATIAWFDDAAFATAATANPMNTTCATTIVTYYAQATCVSTPATTFAAGSVTVSVYPNPVLSLVPTAGICGNAASVVLQCGGATIATETATASSACGATTTNFSGSFTADEIATALSVPTATCVYAAESYGPISAGTCAATPTATVTTTGNICVSTTGTSILDLMTLVTAGDMTGTWSLTTANGTTLAGSTIDAGTAVDGATATATYTITGTDCADEAYAVTISIDDCTVIAPLTSISLSDPCQCNNDASTLTVASDGSVTDLNGVGTGNSDGTFSETVQAVYDADNATADNQYDANVQWRVQSITANVAGGTIPSGIAAADALTDNADGTYSISFNHTSGIGYTIVVEAYYVADPDAGGPLNAGDVAVTGTINNNCSYPEIAFAAMPTVLDDCEGSTFDLSTLTTPATNVSFSNANVIGSIFDAETAGIGTHTIAVTIDPADTTSPASQDGECLQAYTMNINVIACPVAGCEAKTGIFPRN